MPVPSSHLAYPKMPGPQQACRELVASWAEALHSSALFSTQPVFCGNFSSPWIPGLRTPPAGLSGWAVGTAGVLVQESLFTCPQTLQGLGQHNT